MPPFFRLTLTTSLLAIALVLTSVPRVSESAQPNPRTPDFDFVPLTSAVQVAELYFALSDNDPDYVAMTQMLDPSYNSLENEFDKRDDVARHRSAIDRGFEP